ncbi:MAG: tRNA pseudouridine(38-40) synthase TruA [Bacteroidales bacterium]|nr:tRNA pseudouridine(38-40) synthase TruA [Bacteroidales bacterium]
MRYFVKLSYRGTHYHGWQIQPNGITVQEELTKAFSLKLSEPELIITGAGRTDTGVHARNFYAHFDTKLPIIDLDDLVVQMNKFLSKDITIHQIFPVIDQAHARFDALSRTYRYFISTEKDPFFQDFSWYVYGKLNIEKMNQATFYLLGEQDFTSFSKLHTQTKTNICTVTKAVWTKHETSLVFEITADRFLRNMVRAVVGTLVKVGRERIAPEDVKEILLAKSRSDAGESVPAKGLFLEDIGYDFERLKK